MVSPAALSLLTTTNPEGPARSRALAIWQATTARGATTGIIAGGVLTQYLGWRAVFLVNPPVIAIMLLLVGRLPATRPARGQRLDLAGASLITASLGALIFGLSNGQQHGFASPATVTALAVAVAIAAGFVLVEQTASALMLPAALLASPARRTAVVGMLLIGAVLPVERRGYGRYRDPGRGRNARAQTLTAHWAFSSKFGAFLSLTGEAPIDRRLTPTAGET
jgi:hypothetical protein